MPIRPEMKKLYPPDWPAISKRIRTVRAENRCECTGQCGTHHGYCGAENGQPHPVTGSTVVLTVMHLDHHPPNVADDNLLAGCQRCHLAYDKEHHANTRRRTQEKINRQAGQLPMFAAMDLQELE